MSYVKTLKKKQKNKKTKTKTLTKFFSWSEQFVNFVKKSFYGDETRLSILSQIPSFNANNLYRIIPAFYKIMN